MGQKKMSKRETILLGVMGLAVLYGLYAFLLAPSPTTTVKSGQELNGAASNELAGQIVEELKKEALSQTEVFILSQAEAEWAQDPFLGKPLSIAPEQSKAEQAPDIQLTYSGYVMSGNKALAIINGIEYQAGEELEMGGYTVMSMDPEKVVLQPRGKRGVIIVPFVE